MHSCAGKFGITIKENKNLLRSRTHKVLQSLITKSSQGTSKPHRTVLYQPKGPGIEWERHSLILLPSLLVTLPCRFYPSGQTVKNPPTMQETCSGSTHGSGKFPGERNGHPLQYSYLENSKERSLMGYIQSMGPQRVRQDRVTNTLLHRFYNPPKGSNTVTYTEPRVSASG